MSNEKHGELLDQLKEQAGRPMTRDEVRAQKISFVMGMIGKNNDMTREEVAELIDRIEGTREPGITLRPITDDDKHGKPVLTEKGLVCWQPKWIDPYGREGIPEGWWHCSFSENQAFGQQIYPRFVLEGVQDAIRELLNGEEHSQFPEGSK